MPPAKSQMEHVKDWVEPMFQEALIESLPHRTRRVGTVIASASVHAVALGALVWISLQAVGEIEDPPEPTHPFIVGLNPLPLGDGGNRDAVSKTRPHSATLPRTVAHPEQFQPTHEPPQTPTNASDDSKDPSDPKTPGSEQKVGTGGDPKGEKTGTGHEPVAVLGTRNDEISIRFDRPPVLLSRVDPVYPEAARQGHISGTVVLQAVINTAGRVEELRVTKSAGQLLDAAAVSAVEKWIYRPATLNARAVKVYLTVTVDFALH